MTGDKSVQATFVPLRTITAQAQAGGTVSISPSQASYVDGAQVTLTATRQAGYDFTGWTGDVVSSANPLNVTLNQHLNVTATFGPAQPPAVMFNVQNGTVGSRVFTLSGLISDNGTVASARWERDGLAMGALSLVSGQFTRAITFEGLNRFPVIALDDVGNETISELVITWVPQQRVDVLAPAREQEGRLVTVPIRLRSTGNVSGVAFTLTFNPAYLQSEGFEFTPAVSSPFNQVNRSTPAGSEDPSPSRTRSPPGKLILAMHPSGCAACRKILMRLSVSSR